MPLSQKLNTAAGGIPLPITFASAIFGGNMAAGMANATMRNRSSKTGRRNYAGDAAENVTINSVCHPPGQT